MKDKLTLGCLIICFGLLMQLSSACNNNDVGNNPPIQIDTLMPSYTDTGADVVAFKINGRIVIAEDKLHGNRGITMLYYKPVDSPYMKFYLEAAYQSQSRYEGISISIRNLSDTGVYELNEQSIYYSNGGKYLVGKDAVAYFSFLTNDIYRGEVHVRKIDTVNKIISGTFEFEAENTLEELGNVSITEGKFDAIYYP